MDRLIVLPLSFTWRATTVSSITTLCSMRCKSSFDALQVLPFTLLALPRRASLVQCKRPAETALAATWHVGWTACYDTGRHRLQFNRPDNKTC